MDILNQQVGPETNVKISFESGSLKIAIDYAGQDGSASLSGSVKPAALIDALEKAYPGKFSMVVLEELKLVLG